MNRPRGGSISSEMNASFLRGRGAPGGAAQPRRVREANWSPPPAQTPSTTPSSHHRLHRHTTISQYHNITAPLHHCSALAVHTQLSREYSHSERTPLTQVGACATATE
eukprot:1190183-Prorocentrum_minimum.AAC.2